MSLVYRKYTQYCAFVSKTPLHSTSKLLLLLLYYYISNACICQFIFYGHRQKSFQIYIITIKANTNNYSNNNNDIRVYSTMYIIPSCYNDMITRSNLMNFLNLRKNLIGGR